MIELVVARYKEDIKWLDSIKIKSTVYNKHEGDNLLQNVGRESHTYLTHIVRNYDSLSDFILFVQGDPFSHCNDFLNKIESLTLDYKNYQYVGLSDGLITCDENGRPHCGKNHLPVGKLYEYIFEESSPEVFVCNSAGQFGVSKSSILKNSKSLYEKCLKTLEYDSNPVEGFCMERLWTSVFGFKNTMKRSEIIYEDDADVSIEDYFLECISKDGSFIQLGKLGFR